MAGAHQPVAPRPLWVGGTIRSASGRLLSADEQSLLHRQQLPRSWVEWTADVALDDAREALGPRPNRAGKIDDADEISLIRPHRCRRGARPLADGIKDGSRRSLNGSMTVVGDIAQATGPSAPSDWTVCSSIQAP